MARYYKSKINLFHELVNFFTKKLTEVNSQNSCINYLEWFREFWFVLYVARNFQLQPLKHLLHSELSKFAFCQLPIRKTQRPNADVRRIQTYHDGFLQSHLITRFHAHFWNRKRMFLKDFCKGIKSTSMRSVVKVSKSRKQFMYWKLSQRSFFGRIEDTIICFRDCQVSLTLYICPLIVVYPQESI